MNTSKNTERDDAQQIIKAHRDVQWWQEVGAGCDDLEERVRWDRQSATDFTKFTAVCNEVASRRGSQFVRDVLSFRRIDLL